MTRVSGPVFFTICAKNFFAYARTLNASIARYHPGARVYVAVCDLLDEGIVREEEPFEIIEIEQLRIPALSEMIEKYNITELNTSIKPFVFQYLFDVVGETSAIYLDPDILVTGPLQEVVDMLDAGADAVMTPHVLDPAENVEIDDIKMLQLGVYNLGFIAMNRNPRVLEILRWWGRRLERECVIDLPRGLFVDQKWADLLPSFLPNARILHHPGYNVAYWNVKQRAIARGADGWTANGLPLRFVHFSGNNLYDDKVFSRHSWQLNAENVGPINDLLVEYRSMVFAHGHERYSKLPYAFSWNGASGVNLHTPETASTQAVQTAAPAEAQNTHTMPVAAPAFAQARPSAAQSRQTSRFGNALVTLKRARDHAGGWTALALKAGAVYRRGGPTLVRDTIRQLNRIYPHLYQDGKRLGAGSADPVASPAGPQVMPPLGARKRVLFIDWSTPRPDRDAGSITAYYLIKILIDLGHEVIFVPSDLTYLGEYTESLRRIGAVCLHREEIGDIASHLAAYGSTYSYALLCRAPIAGLYVDLIRRHAPTCTVILNTSDLHYLRDIREAEIEGDAEKLQSALRWKAQELDIIRRCDHSIVMSDHELQVLEQELPDANIHLLPLMFVEIPGLAQGFAARKDIVFIGGFPHTPNVDAVVYFCEEIWPIVHARLPDARIRLVGNKPPEQVQRLGDIPGVEVVGYVEDLKPVFDNIRISVAPLRYGAGIKGKLGTSLSYGVPSVATSIAVEGMHLTHEASVLVADTPEAFAEATIRLYTDESLWNRLSAGGLDSVTEHYSVDAGRRRIGAFMATVDAAQSAFPGIAVSDAREYDAYYQRTAASYASRTALEESLVVKDVESFRLQGYCAVCGGVRSFNVGFMYAYAQRSDGGPMPNWREHLDCSGCGFVNRMRAGIHAFNTLLAPAADARIYITEQTTSLYRWLKERYPNTEGSEYLGDKVAFGESLNGLRNENIMATTWPDASFDVVLSFDVLEHVPDPAAAFRECWRILRPGGAMLWAAPFAFDDASRLREDNVVRAYLDERGEIVHLLEPEFHGNPVDPEAGALCYQYFSQQTPDALRQAGFDEAQLIFYWSPYHGYLGGEQVLCVARKSPLHAQAS